MARPGRFPACPARPVAATVPLGHLMFQTKRWNEAIRMARPKGAVAIARHHHAGSVGRTTSSRLRFEARRTSPSGSGDCPVRPLMFPNKAVERSDSYGRPKGAVAIARHRPAGSVGTDDIKATGF
jgi:hypothetical protein